MHSWKEMCAHTEPTSFSIAFTLRVNFFNKMFPMKNSYSSGFLTNSFMMKFHKILKMFLLTIFFSPSSSARFYVSVCMFVGGKSLSAKGFFSCSFPPLELLSLILLFSIFCLSLFYYHNGCTRDHELLIRVLQFMKFKWKRRFRQDSSEWKVTTSWWKFFCWIKCWIKKLLAGSFRYG